MPTIARLRAHPTQDEVYTEMEGSKAFPGELSGAGKGRGELEASLGMSWKHRKAEKLFSLRCMKLRDLFRELVNSRFVEG